MYPESYFNLIKIIIRRHLGNMGSEEYKVRLHRLHVEEIMEEGGKKEFYNYRIVILFFKRRLS